MIRERVPAGTPLNPASGPSQRERVPGEMTLLWTTRPDFLPWGFKVWLEDVQPLAWVTDEMVTRMVEVMGEGLRRGWESPFEVTFRDGALFTLLIRAENGEWTWTFREYDPQSNRYVIEWPD